MTISKIEDKFNLRNSSIVIGLIAALSTSIWPIHLATDRAFAAVNPDFAVHPNATSVHGSLVEQKMPTQSREISFRYQGHTYRARHTIQQWNPTTKAWYNVSHNITQNDDMNADGYQLDHITAITAGNIWYAGTLVGNVIVGRPSSGWKVSSNQLPERTVSAIAELPSDNSIAAVGYRGYASATPTHPGHVYVTLDGGTHWFDISSNLPDAPIAALRFGNPTSTWTLEAKIGSTWYQTSEQGRWRSD